MKIKDTYNTIIEYSKILSFFFRSKKLSALYLAFLSLLYGLIETLTLGAILPVVQYGIGESQQSSLVESHDFVKNIYETISGFLHLNMLATAALMLITISSIAFVYKLFYANFYQRFSANIDMLNRKRLFENISHAPLSYFTSQKQGNLVYNSTIAPDSILSTILTFIELFSEFFKSIFITVMLMLTSTETTLIILSIAILYFFLSRNFIYRYINRETRKIVKFRQMQNIILNEFINGIKTIKAFLKERYWISRYNHNISSVSLIRPRIEIRRYLPQYIIPLLLGLGIGFTAFLIGLQNSDMIARTAPILALFVIAGTRLSSSISLVTTHFGTILSHIPNIRICYQMILETKMPSTMGTKIIFSGFKDYILINHLDFNYPDNKKKVLNSLSMTIKKNSSNAIVGESGSGKSTLMALLLQLYPAKQKSIFIDNIDINTIDSKSYLNKVGYVSQDVFLFNSTIRENLTFNSEISDAQIIQACKKADAHKFIIQTKEAYETIVGDSGMKLSGGQKQRLSIARALLKNPDILIFDEPTSSLDNKSEHAIFNTLQKLSHELTLILIAHRLSTIKNVDKIFFLHKGKILEEGTHNQLMKKNGYYRKLFERHM